MTSHAAFTIDTAMQGAIFRAFYDLNTPSVFSCTSNCTWDQSHISLGFSTDCTDVTEATNATRVCTPDWGSITGDCNMTTPGNVTFNIAMSPTSWTTVLVVKAVPLYQETSYGDFAASNRQLLAAKRRNLAGRALIDEIADAPEPHAGQIHESGRVQPTKRV